MRAKEKRSNLKAADKTKAPQIEVLYFVYLNELFTLLDFDFDSYSLPEPFLRLAYK